MPWQHPPLRCPLARPRSNATHFCWRRSESWYSWWCALTLSVRSVSPRLAMSLSLRRLMEGRNVHSRVSDSSFSLRSTSSRSYVLVLAPGEGGRERRGQRYARGVRRSQRRRAPDNRRLPLACCNQLLCVWGCLARHPQQLRHGAATSRAATPRTAAEPLPRGRHAAVLPAPQLLRQAADLGAEGRGRQLRLDTLSALALCLRWHSASAGGQGVRGARVRHCATGKQRLGRLCSARAPAHACTSDGHVYATRLRKHARARRLGRRRTCGRTRWRRRAMPSRLSA